MNQRIVFDARLITHPGIGRYIRSLLGALLTSKPPFDWILVGPEAELEVFEKEFNIRIRPCRVPIYGVKEWMTMHTYYQDADLVHIPHFNVPRRVPGPFIVTIHDLTYFHVPEYRGFPGRLRMLDFNLRRIAKKADGVITVSEATLRDCRERYPEMSGKIRVVYEAADDFFLKEDVSLPDIRGKYGLKDPYVLFVGSLREHKNVQGLVTAYEAMQKTNPVKADLVLVGQLDERFNRKYAFRSRILRNKRIRYLGPVSDLDLKSIYKSAACFVLPSFYEGFGLPVIEAMASRVPVIASNASSLPEIVAEAGLTFQPDKIDDLSRLLYNVLSDQNLRQDLAARGYTRASFFSWEKAARETLRVYNEVLVKKVSS